ncbi:hypothetical protein BZG88_28700 [Salmonella enterica]|nr:hypothetical protein [Salmonella enterica]EAM8742430.1 hypothetical protein [Salmonella enterica]EAZ9079779.1 hypothetical protein [Salmonella enterica]
MNMKKITGMLVGAVLVCGDASAAPKATAQVPLGFTITGDTQSVVCTFEGNQARPNVTAQEALGTLICANTNSTSVTFAMIAGGGTSAMDGTIALSDGSKRVIAELIGKSNGSRLPVVGAEENPDTPAVTNYTIPAGQKRGAELRLLSDESGLPAGEYKGSVVIGTWAA